MPDYKSIQNKVFELIQDGLTHIYRANATAKSRTEILTSEILHIMRICGESYDRPHWRIPMEKLLDLAIEDEDNGTFNWGNETWLTSLALLALAPSLDPNDEKTRLHRILNGAARWLLNERGGWKDTWDGELWETCLAVIALMHCKDARLVSGRQLRWYANVLDWLIDTGTQTKGQLGYHYCGLVLWALEETSERYKLKPAVDKKVDQAKIDFSTFILKEMRTAPELVMPGDACWMTGLILYGIIRAGQCPDDPELLDEILEYIEHENQSVAREGWYDLDTTYYMLLALTELYHFIGDRLSAEATKGHKKIAYKSSVRELHVRLKGLREAAEKPVMLLSPGCPIGHESCKYRESAVLDERYDDRKVFLAIPFSGYKAQQKIIEEVLELANLIPVISNPEAEQDHTSTNILCQICQRIGESRYGLVDLTGVEQRPNIAYELGLLHAFNRKVGLLVQAKKNDRDSIEQHFSDIKQLQYHKYPLGEGYEISLAKNVRNWICSIKASNIDVTEFKKDFASKFTGTSKS